MCIGESCYFILKESIYLLEQGSACMSRGHSRHLYLKESNYLVDEGYVIIYLGINSFFITSSII